MTSNSTLWLTLQAYLPRKTWIPMSEIVATVQSRVTLDEEDLERKGSSPGTPLWESNLRSLLRTKTRAGHIRARRRTPGRD